VNGTMPFAQPTRTRAIVAWLVVILTVLAVWKFADYRNQPPLAPQPVTSDK
jgi:hypothetical protein